MNPRMRFVVASAALASALALAFGPAQAASNPAPVVTESAPPPAGSIGPAPSATLTFGQEGSGASSSGGGSGGPVVAGPPLPCTPGGFDIDGTLTVPGFGIASGPYPGIVNVPTWFWTTSYSGKILLSKDIRVRRWCVDGVPGYTPYNARLALWPSTYRWTWGDGTQDYFGNCPDPTDINAANNCTPDALGVQDQPEVTHLYTDSSAGYPQGYLVSLEVQFTGALSIDYGPGPPLVYTLQDLGAQLYPQRASTLFDVREVEAILVPAPNTGAGP